MKTKGQAMIEYLMVLMLLAFIGVKTVQYVGKWMATSMGNLANVLSIHLSVGVCGKQGGKNCFFSGFKNGPEN